MNLDRTGLFVGLLSACLFLSPQLQAAPSQLELGKSAIQKMPGCYLIDYSYTETESLKPGYERDSRVYDVNVQRSVKEWIYNTELSPTHIRVQHILFFTDLAGNSVPGTELRHQAEDWEYDAPFLYDFTGPSSWTVKAGTPGTWTRRVTNLDDGLRYQCASTWSESAATPEWNCANYAPIPGRETRDMGRKDYNTLDRMTRLMMYSGSWLERQINVKTIHGADGSRTPLAREMGKNWYVRLPDSECAPAIAFVQPRQEFWSVLREAWAEVLVGDRDFNEITKHGPGSRYFKILEIEQNYMGKSLMTPAVRQAAKDEIKAVIQEFRK